jgi:hypothetical protein
MSGHDRKYMAMFMKKKHGIVRLNKKAEIYEFAAHFQFVIFSAN